MDSSKALNDKLAQLDQRVTAAQSSADNSWMMVSAALVLMMTGPGLTLFYGGLVRRKNMLAIMMQSFMLMAVISVLWALVGYSLAFGGNGPVVGGFEHAFLRGVGAEPNPDYAGTIPQATFMIYQLMFAIITPALITGATAERMKFSGTVLFLDAVVFCGVRAARAHGLGQGRFAQCGAGWQVSVPGLRGRNGRSYQFGRVGVGVRAVHRQADRISETADAAAQPDAELCWRVPVVGWMVWV